MSDVVQLLRRLREKRGVSAGGEWRDPDCRKAADEIERLRAIVRVNGLRWGHTHAEIDAMLSQSNGDR